DFFAHGKRHDGRKQRERPVGGAFAASNDMLGALPLTLLCEARVAARDRIAVGFDQRAVEFAHTHLAEDGFDVCFNPALVVANVFLLAQRAGEGTTSTPAMGGLFQPHVAQRGDRDGVLEVDRGTRLWLRLCERAREYSLGFKSHILDAELSNASEANEALGCK